MTNIDIAYPLHWPQGQPRAKNHQRSRFNTTFAMSRDLLVQELKRMGAKYVTVSTNVTLRRDGLPYASQTEPDDKGVAVYFDLKGESMVLACDRWNKVGDNIQALNKTVEALRGIERWGSTDLMNRAFNGFKALPASSSALLWYQVFGVDENAPHSKVKEYYKEMLKNCHPDHGGTVEEFETVQRAWAKYQKVGNR